MRKLVIILGAGASWSAGLPVLSRIFEDDSVKKYLAGDAAEFQKFLEKYIWAPRGIGPGDRGSSLNLEEVLTMLRQWRYQPRPRGGRESNPYAPLNHARNDRLQRQLLGCVYHSVFVDKSGKDARDYNGLLQRADEHFDQITWASFNWDALVEQAFYWHFYGQGRLPQCPPDLEGWDGEDDKHTLLKLHGSVTWFSEERADGKPPRVFYVRYGKTQGRDEVSDHWKDYLSGRADAPRPMIAEPSFFKHEDLAERPFLLRQWNMFESAIVEADVVLVIGYSMPEGDTMAKQSLLTAVARKPRARFVIVDPDFSDTVMPRYERILGPSRTQIEKMGFSEFLNKYPSLSPLMPAAR